MHIIIYSQHFFPDNFRINDLVKNTNDKVKYTVITSNSPYSAFTDKHKFNSNYDHEFFEDVKVIRLPVIPRTKKFRILARILNYISYVISASIYTIFFKKENYDHILCYLTSPPFQVLPAILLSKIKKIKISIWYQDLWPHNLKDLNLKLPSWIFYLIDKFMYFVFSNCHIIFCQSELFKEEVDKLIPNKKTVILYNPITLNIKKINYNNLINNNKKIFTFTGNIGVNIPYDEIIKSILELKDLSFEFHFYGFGTHKNYFQNIINKNNLKNIILFDYLEDSDLKIKMMNSDFFCIFLNSGYGLSKTIPAKFQNYLPFKKPILVYSEGILNKLVSENEIGFECMQGDYIQLSNLILKMIKLKNEDLLKFEKNIENFSDKFTIKNVSKTYLNNICIK